MTSTLASHHSTTSPAILSQPHGPWAVHDELVGHIGEKAFPCVGAKSVFNRGRYRLGTYAALGSPEAARALCDALATFSTEFPSPLDEPASFIAVFEPAAASVVAGMPDAESAFEHALWTHLRRMHELDRQAFEWDPRVSDDPQDPAFSFSIGGRGYYIVGLHPAASRQSRRTPRPTLVFNLHEQFETLRQSGKYAGLRDAIRRRDLALQGSVNPMLDDHGQASEARQYSGRPVAAEWRCPFHREGASS